MAIRLDITSNGKARGLGLLRAILDFFFPYPAYDRNGIGIIRHEASTNVLAPTALQPHGRIDRTFYTFRALSMHYLLSAFAYLKFTAEFLSLTIHDPLFSRVGAIAFDVSTDGGSVNPGTSLSWSHTVTGSNPGIFTTGSNINTTDIGMTSTYNGSSAPLVASVLGNAHRSWLFFQPNPATGAHTAALAFSSAAVAGSSDSYSGVANAAPEAHNTATGNSASITASVTTITTNAWTVMKGRAETGGTFTAGTGTTLRGVKDAVNGQMCDSNAALASGSHSLAITISSQQWSAIICSVAPFASANNFTRTMSDSILNGASRSATISKGLARTMTDSLMNAASRLASVTGFRGYVRTVSATVSNATGRLATVSKSFIIKIGNTIRWGFFTWN